MSPEAWPPPAPPAPGRGPGAARESGRPHLRRSGRAYRRRMTFTATALVPLLSTSAAGLQSQTFMPFVLILAPIALVLLLVLFVGRQRRNRKPGDHD